tara:strand:+ start:39 stop:197 length:159 start_codon:yes stop_codon:yes gene_type:complete
MSDGPIIFEKIKMIAKLKEDNKQLRETIKRLEEKINSLERATLFPRGGLPWS